MKYEPNQIYHIFNQGNNKQAIFFNEKNYLFFLRKMRKHLLPFVDILCYCLMPNHFHWLVCAKREACLPSKAIKPISKRERSKMEGILKMPSISASHNFQQNLSLAIGTLLAGYTKAINRQENRTGSLFRGKTKAKNGIIDGFITVNGKNSGLFFMPENNYGRTCFYYIHENPSEAGLVEAPTDWRYSSAKDFAGLRKGTMCNQELARKLLFL